MKNKIILLILIMFFAALKLTAQQPISSTFELRYFTNDTSANGETDFKGVTEWMDTEQRIAFLNQYAKVASNFFSNPNLDKEIVTDLEIENLLNKIKSQPTTSIRKTIQLENWKAYGYRAGQILEKELKLKHWEDYNGASIRDGNLIVNNCSIDYPIDSLTWRFKVETTIRTDQNSSFLISLLDGNKQAIVFGFEENKLIFGSTNKLISKSVSNGNSIKLKIEADITQKRFNLYADDKLIEYFIPIMDTSIQAISQLSLISKGISELDDIFIFNYIPTNNIKAPYISSVVLDENFETKPAVSGWQNPNFDDNHWESVVLPSVHGGVRNKEEDYFLRKNITIGDFERAVLKLETLDPGGEIWINGDVVGVVNNRHPVELDITKNLIKESENTIAIKVKAYKLNNPMHHSPTDHYVGWFLGKSVLELSNKCKITEVLVNTEKIGFEGTQKHKISIHYPTRDYFEGSIEVNYYPWFPEEGDKIASVNRNLSIPPRITNEYNIDLAISDPQLWSSDNPFLYKVEVILRNKEGIAVDDFVTTTGIRTVEQKEGDFYVNGKQEMLNGAQIMGFRTPIETVSKYNRSAPIETLVEELLMIKKMGANLLRVHVHAEEDTIDGINDPRIAQLADQMGVMLIWTTAGFIRVGEAWNIDFEGYPKFMRQVYNHPSIVIWEASNHPNMFKEHDISDTHNYVTKIYNTIYSQDQSRLISPTTFWEYTHYANSSGTVDYKGNTITAVPEFTAHQVTRGSQDSYTGYGREWTALRNAPTIWAASCLEDKDRAYFNFEHEESIGQPNWELCKGKPWYLLQSYEWGYDKGSIGRKLTTNEWRESQAWQAFSAWESMKKQMILGYDGFSWCCLRGGANMGTYKKPLIDNLRHPKLAYYTNKMAFQRTWAGSNNVDVVYGPQDKIVPVIHHLGGAIKIDLIVELKNSEGKVIETKKYESINLESGRDIKHIDGFKFKDVPDLIYSIEYKIINVD